jgi:hypothetical protein
MKQYICEIEINRYDFDRINKLMQVDFDDIDENGDLTLEMENLVNELDARQDTTPYGFWFEFENGTHITIDICCGSHNYFDDVVWTSKDGTRDCVFDCNFALDEVEEFDVDDDVYICKFIIKED